uniref:Uncharacterized protein n=2 Tax=Timema TaxID=61471 RepID=A0A7R8ZCB3_TIMDO|nr:unnamed protein product [Timema douglasi]
MVFFILLDDEPPMIVGGVQPEDPNSLDQLLQFTEYGICRADGDWSMDYWDPYGLDEGLAGNVATCVPEANPVGGAQHGVVAGPLPDPATLAAPLGNP